MHKLYNYKPRETIRSQLLTTSMQDVKNTEQRARLKERNEKIRADYMKEWNRGFRTEKIVVDLGKKYFLKSDTVEKIVFERAKYAEF
jgi:hypothetical protein